MDKVIKMQMINQYVGGMPKELVEIIDGFIKESYEEEKRLVRLKREKVFEELLDTTKFIYNHLNDYSDDGIDFDRETRELDKHYFIGREIYWCIFFRQFIFIEKYEKQKRLVYYHTEKRLVYYYREMVFEELLEITEGIFNRLNEYSEIGKDFEKEAREFDNYYSIAREEEHDYNGNECGLWYINCV